MLLQYSGTITGRTDHLQVEHGTLNMANFENLLPIVGGHPENLLTLTDIAL